jgi:catechol 2,3-dioxygenase-like lactoylglutathione lyase family enzyme
MMMSMASRLETSELYTTILRVRSLDRSVEFYQRVFDLQPTFRDLTYPLVSMTNDRGMRLTFWETTTDEAVTALTPESGFVTFITTDAAASHVEISRRDATVSPLDRSKPGVCFFWVTDPDGHSLLVIQLLPD